MEEEHQNSSRSKSSLGEKKIEKVSDDSSSLNPSEDPYKKATSYMAQHNIVGIFQRLTSKIFYERPPDMIDFIIKELEQQETNDNTTD